MLKTPSVMMQRALRPRQRRDDLARRGGVAVRETP